MKVRQGFVSNSSSSSFLIFGSYIPIPNDVEYAEDYYAKFEEAGLSAYEDEGSVYVGLSWDKVGDDETGKQFKERVKRLITSVQPDISKFYTYSKCYRTSFCGC